MGQIRKRYNTYFIRYYRNGRRYEESTHSSFKKDAVDLLRLSEGDIAKGVPVTPKIGQLRFEEAAQDILADYTTNARRSTNTVERRLRLHLAPWFDGRRLASLTTSDVRAFVAHRQKAGASNGEVNRELTVLKRMFALTIQGGKLLHKPYIPLLRETNTRRGFLRRTSSPVCSRTSPRRWRPCWSFRISPGGAFLARS